MPHNDEIVDQNGLVYTFGQLTADGGIDLLECNRLIRYRSGEVEVASTLSVDGKTYVAAPIDPSLACILQFPDNLEEFGTLDSLVADLGQAFRTYLPVDERTQLLLAAFVLATWVPEALPTPPVLNLWGPPGSETTLVGLLQYLCRRSLILANASVQDLCTLPPKLSPTLVFTQPSERTVKTMLAAAAVPQQALLRRGRLQTVRHAVIICTRRPLPAPALAIPVDGVAGEYHRFTNGEQQQIIEKLAPRLLCFRLSHHVTVSGSRCDCPTFAAATRILVRTLGSVLEGSATLQHRLIAALGCVDEDTRVEASQELPALVLEALLVLIRENRQVARVEEVTDLLNGILIGRGESRELSPKKVGGVLRSELGFCAKRQAHGYELLLDRQTCLRITQLAESYGVLTLHSLHPGAQTSRGPSQWSSESVNVHDVHDVHQQDAPHNYFDVHDVHEVHPSTAESTT